VAEDECKSHQKMASGAINGKNHASCSLPLSKPRLSRDSLAGGWPVFLDKSALTIDE
jgi:hypothetical protein